MDCVANPIGLVDALLERFADKTTVHILDMEGISKKDLDISHVFACRILQDVPCTEEWIDHMPHPAILNQKFGNPGITQKQLDEMEWMFLQRDCSYYEEKSLLDNPRLKVHHGETLAEPCSNPSNGIPRSVFANATMLLKLLQGQMGCGGSSLESVLGEIQVGQKRPYSAEALTPDTRAVKSKVQATEIESSSATVIHDMTHNVLRFQLYALVFAMVVFVCLILRQVKFKKRSATRRR